MPVYVPPIRDMAFTMSLVSGCSQSEAGFDMVIAQLAEAGRLAAEVLAPLNGVGDAQGCLFLHDRVGLPKGYREAYGRFVAGGWPGVCFPGTWGGQGASWLAGTALAGLWSGANMALSLCSLTTLAGAYMLERRGDQALRASYLPNLVSGLWAAAIAVVEPERDPAQMTRARPEAGHWRISGEKALVVWGEQDLTETALVFVLANTPGGDRPSLFLVPRRMPDGGDNEVHCIALEQTMGLRGCPVVSLVFGRDRGSAGWLVGQEGQGRAALADMAEMVRLLGGLQAVSVAERAYQVARAHARAHRVQGRPLIDRPDIRLTLLSMQAEISAARAVAYDAGRQLDLAGTASDPEHREQAKGRFALLSPLMQQWGSEIGLRVAGDALRVMDGASLGDQTGAGQHVRDIRAAAQTMAALGMASDSLLLVRALRDDRTVRDLLDGLDRDRAALAKAGLTKQVKALGRGRRHLAAAAEWLALRYDDADSLAAAQSPFLRLCGTVLGGQMMARAALLCAQAEKTQAEKTQAEKTQAEKTQAEKTQVMDASLRQSWQARADHYLGAILPRTLIHLLEMRQSGQAAARVAPDLL